MIKGLLILWDSNGERDKEYLIEFESNPKVVINTIPTFVEGKYSGEKPIGHKWENFKFKTLNIDRIPNPLRTFSFISGSVEYFVEGVTEYKGNGNYETTIYKVNQKL